MLKRVLKYADLNAFLLVAVQSHAMPASFDPDRVRKIIAKGKEGGDASVGLACGELTSLPTLPR